MAKPKDIILMGAEAGDLLTLKGGYGSRQKFPLVPLSDGAGVVEPSAPTYGRLLLATEW